MGIITQNWSRMAGAGSLPLWVCVGACTWDETTLRWMELYAVPEEKLKLVPIPNSRELAAARIDGKPITLGTIYPTGYTTQVGKPISDCVLIGPIVQRPAAPWQTAGDYTGYTIVEYVARWQQTKPNDYAYLYP